MQDQTRTEDGTRLIDLTNQTDTQFWCRVFDVSMDQLRRAVQHAGHKVDDVQRYLRENDIKAD